jgi:hypothetical protein
MLFPLSEKTSMGAWLSNISLKYKFWAVNAVAFVTTLLLVLYAVQPRTAGADSDRPGIGPGPGSIAQRLARGAATPKRIHPELIAVPAAQRVPAGTDRVGWSIDACPFGTTCSWAPSGHPRRRHGWP